MKHVFVFVLLFGIQSYAQLSGIYYIGATGTKPGGGNPEYTSLAGAVSALNSSGINGPCTFYFTESKTYTEAVNLSLGCTGTSATNTITFKPYTNITATIDFTSTTGNQALPALDGQFLIGSPTANTGNLVSTNYVIFDGDNGGTQWTRGLILQGVAGNYSNVGLIRIFGDCNNITVKKCVLKVRSTSGAGLGNITVTNFNDGTINYTPDDISIENDSLINNTGNGNIAVYCVNAGTPTTFATNVTIKSCYLQGKQRGVYFNYFNNADIFDNTISVVNGTTGAAAAGIYLAIGGGGAGTFNIYRNSFVRLSTPNTTAGNSNGIIGIDNVLASPKIINVYNNYIRGFEVNSAAVTNAKIYGIRSTSSSTCNVYFNSIYIPELTNMTTFGSSYIAAVVFASTGEVGPSSSASLTVKNNIIVSDETSMKVWNIRRVGTTGTFASDYNDIYVNPSSASGYTGFYNASDCATLSDWQTASSQDFSSFAGNPRFTSTTNLAIDLTKASFVSNAGTPISSPSITTDIDGNSRDAANPDIGADEFSYSNYTSGNITGGYNNLTTSGDVTLSGDVMIDGTLTLGGKINTNGYSLILNGTASITAYSSSNYINGALSMRVNLSSTAVFKAFPIGKASYQLLELYNFTSSTIGNKIITAEVFDANSGGTAGTLLNSLNSNRYWKMQTNGNLSPATGNIRLTESGVNVSNKVGQSNTLTGTYNNKGGILSGNTLQTVSNIDGSNLSTGTYFVVGTPPSLSGMYSIGATGNYTSLGAVASDLIYKYVSGNVVCEFAVDYSGTETAPITFYQFGDDNYSVTIRPATGVTGKTITLSSANPIIDLNGVKNLILDGRPGGTGSSKDFSIANSGTGPAVRFINDAKTNTLKYCNLQSSATSSSSATILFSTTSGTTGNDDNIIDNCSVIGGGQGIYSLGTDSKENSGNLITNNNIYDYYISNTSGTATYGIRIYTNNSNWTISGNSFYQTQSRSYSSASEVAHRIIDINNTGVNYTINNNYFGGSAPLCGGSPYTISGGTIRLLCMNLSVGNGTASSIQGNIVKNFSLTTATVSSSTLFSMMYIADGSYDIGSTVGNSFGDTSSTDNILVTLTGNVQGTQTTGVYLQSTSGTINFQNNAVSGMSLDLNNSSTAFSSLYPVLIASSTAPGTYNVTGNLIGSNTTSNSIQLRNCANADSAYYLRAIYASNGTVTISNNTVNNVSLLTTGSGFKLWGIGASRSTSVTSTNTITGNVVANLTTTGASSGIGTSSGLIGICYNYSSNTPAQTISNNTIYGLKNTSTSSVTSIIGLMYESSQAASTTSIEKNRIYGITSSSLEGSLVTGLFLSTGSTLANNNMISLGKDASGVNISKCFEFSGLRKGTSAANKIINNTVLIEGTVNAPDASVITSAFKRSTTGASDSIYNNIFMNIRSDNTSNQKHFALNYDTPTTILSNYNLLYCPNGYTGTTDNGTTTYTTISDWRTATSQDSNSVSGSVPFLSSTDLHCDVADNNCWNVNGMGTPRGNIPDDFNATSVRSTTVAGGASDIGCDEFTPSVNPPDATVTGTIANASTTTFTNAGKTIGSIDWHNTTGTLPSAVAVKYFGGANASGNSGKPRSNGYWQVTATGGSGYTYDITLNYDPNMIGNISSESNIRLAKSENNSDWVQYAVAGTEPMQYALNTTAKTVKVYGLSSFSYFTLGDNSELLPVELTTFASSANGRNILLEWATATEVNSSKFVIERSDDGQNWLRVGDVQASGYSNAPRTYGFTDKNLMTAKYNYRLKIIDNDGTYEYSQVISAEVGAPTVFNVSQNYPNPFNPSTKINYDIPEDARVVLELYALTGEKIAVLVNEAVKAGYYSYQVNMNRYNLPSGVYVYRLVGSGVASEKKFSSVKKMMYLR